MEQKIIENFTISDLYRANSMSEVEDIFSVTEDIIQNLDEYAINELCEGYSWDIDKLFLDIVAESNILINSGEGAKSFSFNYLEKLTDSLDNYLKDLSLSYFVSNCLSDFDMEPYHIEWFNMIQIYRFLVLLAARGHSKSFCISYAYPLWRMWKYKGKGKIEKELTLITAEDTLSGVFINQIKQAIQDNPLLKEKLYPKSSEGVWATHQVTTKNGFTLRGKGLNSSLRGLHTDIICDDILDDSNFYNANVRKQTIEYFHSVIENIPLPRVGRITVVGTVFSNEDLYADLKTAKNWRVFEYPGILPDGSTLSKRFTLKELLDKKESQGSISFSREILMRPITNQTSLFPMRVMQINLVDTIEMVYNKYSFPIKLKKIGFGVDLAIAANTVEKEEKDSDFFCVAIVGLDEYSRYWLLNLYRNRGLSYLQQINVVKKLNNEFSPDVIMCENNQYQLVFAQMLKDNGLLNVLDQATTTKNKYSFKIGLPAISVLFEQSRFKIPYAPNTYTRNLADTVMMEFNSITFQDNKLQGVGGHDDIPMAIFQAISGLNYVNSDLIVSFIDINS